MMNLTVIDKLDYVRHFKANLHAYAKGLSVLSEIDFINKDKVQKQFIDMEWNYIEKLLDRKLQEHVQAHAISDSGNEQNTKGTKIP
jgi:hypothetical protein